MRSLRCVVVIPTYNNSATLAGVIASCREYCDDVIVVNDGSTDSTASVLAAIEGVSVISYEKNRGKGYALQVALREATRRGFEYAITIDSDGQHFADDIPVFIDRIEQCPGALLIGARNIAADNMPSKNTFANRFSNFWYKVETGITLADTQSGFRLYPLRAIEGIRLLTRRYEFEVEIIVRAAWRGVRVENVPIKVYYAPPSERVSHFRPLQDFTRISILNTVLVFYALLFYYPWRFLRSLTWENIKAFFNRHLFHSPDSNLRMAASMGWGVFCGIIPLWGYQMVFAALSAHLLRLNKVVAVVFSNVSVPPMIPLIVFGSVAAGAWIMGVPFTLSMEDLSLERIGGSLLQYTVGSVALGAVAGVVTMAVGWILMTLCKRGGGDE